MHIAILTFEGFNEIDSLVALGILGRVRKPGWRVSIAAPSPRVTSMSGVGLEASSSLADVRDADAVIVGELPLAYDTADNDRRKMQRTFIRDISAFSSKNTGEIC